MGDGALSVASRLIAITVSCEAVKEAFETSLSIWGAKEELEKLQKVLQKIASGLCEEEVRQQADPAVWEDGIVTLRDVLYEAEDMFDEVAATHLLKRQQMKGNSSHLNEVLFALSKLNLIDSRDSVASRVKSIRKSLESISKDMLLFNNIIKQSPYENLMAGLSKRVKTTPYLNETQVVGRDDEKKAILDSLFNKSGCVESNVSIIAIVGIGGIGKTTLARVIFNNEAVQKNFKNKWWASTSGISEEREVLEMIFRFLRCKESHPWFTIDELYSAVISSMSIVGNYLLVLDDVCDYNASLWHEVILRLLRGTTGGKIIVTTRSLSIAKVTLCADQTWQLDGLRKKESWQLFKMIAVQPELENDPLRIRIGREIVERCHNVPLAIHSIATHLRSHVAMHEWASFTKDALFDASVMSNLRVSYDPLPLNLKNCFAYCSLFPEDYVFGKLELIYLWIAQGYLISGHDTPETMGYKGFAELLNRSLFHKANIDEYGEIFSCSMHPFIRYLAENVAGDGSTILANGLSQFHGKIRHLSVGYAIDHSWTIPPALLNAKRLRSFLFLYEGSLSPLSLEKLLAKFKFLRALSLRHQKIGVVPSFIGKLLHLRYLNLSHNKFTNLPDSIVMLVNLLTLDISWCQQLVLLPDEFRKLTNLRHLDIRGCYRLRHMPPRFGELTSLQYLSFFKVGEVGDASSSSLDALARLELEGELEIMFDENTYGQEDEERWQLPGEIRALSIKNYQGGRLPCLETTLPSSLCNLVRLFVGPSSVIKKLSPFRVLPYLKTLQLSNLYELEYIDTNEGMKSPEATTNNTLFFPSLEDLTLERLPKLTRWSTEVEAVLASKRTSIDEEHSRDLPSLPLLSKLTIQCCQELESMPLCPSLRVLKLNDTTEKMVQWFCSPSPNSSPSSTPSSLVAVTIRGCDSITSFPGETLASLQHLELRYCDNMKNLHLALPKSNALEELVIESCPELELWETGVVWDCIPNLRKLTLLGMPKPEKLPDRLQKLQEHGNLLVSMERQSNKKQANQLNDWKRHRKENCRGINPKAIATSRQPLTSWPQIREQASA